MRVAWSNGPGGRLATHLARHHGPNAVGALVAELSHHLDEATTIASMTGRYPHSGADTSVLDHLDPSDGDSPGTSYRPGVGTRLAGLSASGGVPYRAHAMLARWWKDGWCVAGLLYASARHPDRPDRLLGDLLTRSRDPLAVLGARLRPWDGRLAQLPAGVIGHRMPEPVRPQPAPSVAPTPRVGTRVRDEAQADIQAQLQAINARVAARRAAAQPAAHQPRLLPRRTLRRRT